MSEPKLPEHWHLAINGPFSTVYLVADKQAESGKTEVFELRKTAYYDVYMYILTGMSYPPTKQRFDEMVPQNECKLLEDKDSTAWMDTRDALVQVQNECQKFNDENMAIWTEMTSHVIQYCNYALDNLEGKDNFTAQLEILAGDRYAKKDNKEPVHDDTYKDAKEVLVDICEGFQQQASDFYTECVKHVEKLEAFRNTTLTSKQKIDDLDFRFNSTTDKNDKPRMPLIAFLNADLAKVRDDEAKQLKVDKEAKDDYDHDVRVINAAWYYGWYFPIGTAIAVAEIVIYNNKAIAAARKFEEAEKEYKKDVDKEKALVTLSNWVTHLGMTFHSLDIIMGNAIESMKAIKEMFSQQADSFKTIMTELGDAESKFDKDYVLRKRILTRFYESATQWHKVRKLAEDFRKTKDVEVTVPTNLYCEGAFVPLHAKS